MAAAKPAALAAAVLVVFVARAAADTRVEEVVLQGDRGWRFGASVPATVDRFMRDWGQFEVLVERQAFPLPAPKCRSEIKLRWPAIVPDAPQRDERLRKRWAVLEQLRSMRATGSSPGEARIALDLRHYTRRQGDGTLALAYCNAFAAEPLTPR